MKKRINRIIPCSPCDLAGVQHYLEEMALRGRILQTEPLFHKYAFFEIGEPQAIRYRLTPSVDGKDPGGDELLYARELGWEYKLLWGQFHIYASSDPNAPELNTDPAVMALAMKPAIRRTVFHLLTQVLILLILPIWGEFFTFLLAPNGWMLLMLLPMLALTIGGGLRNLIRLIRMRKKLLDGQSIAPSPAYRKTLPRFWTGFILGRAFGYAYVLMLIIAAASLFLPASHDISAAEADALPFATLSDVLPESLTEANVQRENRTLNTWDTLLSSENHEYYQGASLVMNDSTGVTCSLTVRYHETISGGYAELVADEMVRSLQSKQKDGDHAEILSIDGLDAVYVTGRRSAAMVIRDGNTVLHVTCMVHYVDDELGTCLNALRRFADLYAREVTS